MSIIVGIFFNIRLQDYLGAYPTYSNNFNPLQVNHLLERDQDHGKYFHSKILVNHKVLEHQ